MVNAGSLSIRWWLSILAAALAVPLLVLLFWLYFSQVRREEQEARETALRIARATVVRMRALQADASSLLQRIAARPAAHQKIDAQSCESLFAVVDFDSEDENLYLFDAAGHLICAGNSEQSQTIFLAGQHWVEQELQSGRLKPRVPKMGMIEGHWASALSMPLKDANATLVLIQLPEAFDDSLAPDAVMTIVDAEGTIVSRSADGSGRLASEAGIIQLAKNRREGIAEAKGVDGVSKQYGFATLPDLGWHIYVGIPTSSVMQPVQQDFLRGVAGGVIIVIAIIVIAAMLSRAIERPVAALSRAAEAAAGGAFESVDAAGPREIAQLANTFNFMLARRLESERRQSEGERELKALSERLLLVQEEERTRIARELHDDLGQALTALKMDFGGLLAMSQPSAAGGDTLRKRIMTTIDDTVTAVQRISSELRPSVLDDLGLAAAIEAEASRFEERTAIECELSLPDHDGLHVSSAAVTAIYRIVQEALTNVARHADARRVELRLRQRPEELLLEIRDDGRGITAEEVSDPRSLGLIGIRERADLAGGTVHFEGIAGRGTIVSVRIPTRTAQT